MKNPRHLTTRAALIVLVGLLLLLAFGKYTASEGESLLAVAAFAITGAVIALLVGAAILRRPIDPEKTIVAVLALIVVTSTAGPNVPAWLDGARAVLLIAAALLLICPVSEKGARRRTLVLAVAGVALGALTGVVLLA